jgi:hypothetical protein
MPSKRIINPEVAEPHWPLMRIDEITEPDAPAVYGILQAGPHLPDGIPYVRPAEIQNDKINVEKVLRTSPEIARRYRRSALKTHDVYFPLSEQSERWRSFRVNLRAVTLTNQRSEFVLVAILFCQNF